MNTLLRSNVDAALIGSYDGSVRTIHRPKEMTTLGWQMLIRKQCTRERGHWSKDADSVPYTRHGAYRPIGPMTGFIETTTERLPIETYVDSAGGLSVRAVYVRPLRMWVIADK